MKRFSLILLLLFWVLQMQAITVIVKVTHNGQPLKEYLPDVTGNENGFSNYMRFRVWLNGTEEDAMTDGDDGLSELWELEANGDMYLSFDTDMLTMKPAGKTLWVEVTESKTGLTWKEKFLLPNHTVEDAVLDLIGVYDPKPIIKINEPLAVCFPTTVNLKDPAITAGSDNLTFNYFTDRGCTSGLGNTTISAVGKNTYYIYGVNDAGISSDTAEINVTINQSPTITLTATNGAGGNVVDGATMCKGAGLSLNVIGVDVGNGGTYAWSIVGGGTDDKFKQETGSLTAQNDLNPSTDIKYQVIGKNLEGCSDTKSLTLNVNEVPVVNLTPKSVDAVVCAGVDLAMAAGATASDGQNIIDYEWSTGGNASTATFNSTTAGTEKVFVTVTQTNGCKKADTTTVTVKPVPTEVKITPVDAICENAQNVQFTANAKESGVIFAWTAPVAQVGKKYIYTPTASDITAGSVDFKVVATLNGCEAAEFTQNITVNPKPALTKPTVTGNKDVCYNSEVQLNFTETAGNTYVWTVGGNVQSIAGNHPTVKIANTGNFAYVVKVTNNTTHCSDTASVQLTGHRVSVGRLTKNLTSDVTPGKAVMISAPSLTYTPNTSNGTLVWSPADKIDSGAGTATITTTSLQEGTEKFQLIAGDEFGCKDSNSIEIVVRDASPIKINKVLYNAKYCSGDKIEIEVQYTGGLPDKTKTWAWVQGSGVTPPAGITDNKNSSKWIIDSKDLAVNTEYKIRFKVQDSDNRNVDTLISFKLNDVPKIIMEGPKSVCAFTQVALNPTVNAGAGSDLTGATYAWVNFTNRDKSSITAGVLAEAMAIPGADLNKYVLTVTDASGCKAVDTARVTGRQVVVDVTPADKSIVYGVSETLGATVSYIPADNTQGNVTYAWTPADSVADATAVPTNTVHLRGTTKFKLTVTAAGWTCFGTDSVTLTVTGNALIAAPKTDKNLYCANDTVKLLPVVSGGSGKYEFTWTGAVTSTDSVSVLVRPAGTYTVNLVVKDKETGLELPSQAVTFMVKQLPTITMPGRPADVCKEGEMTLTATVNSANNLTTAVYAWTAVRGTILNSTDAVADVKASGQAGEDQFILKVTDDAGCMLSDTTKVKVHAITLPKVNIPAVACGKTAQLDITQEATCLGSEPMTYTWGPAELFGGTQVTGENVTTENIEGNTAFFIEVKESGHNCVDTLTGNISPQGCDFTITTDDVAVCEGGSVQLQVNSSMQTGVTYNWIALDAGTIDANGVVNAIGLTAGQSYRFEVTAIYTVSPGLEVERKDTATVKIWEKPAVTLTQSGGTCANEIVTFTAEVEKGTLPYTRYVWRGAEQIDGTPDKATLVLTGTAQNVSVTVTDKNGCTGTDNKNGITGDRIVVSLSADPGHQVAAGDLTTLTATVTTGTAASLEFRRIKPDWVQLAPPSPATTATDNPVKVSTYQVLAVTAGGCKDSSDYIVNVVDNELTVNGTNLLLCEEQSLENAYLTARAYGGVVLETNKGYEFTWVAPAGVKLADAATSTNFGEGSKIKLVEMPAAGDYTITVTVKDKNGKSKSTSLLLRVKAKPEIKINGDTQGDMMACVGTEPFKLTATGPAGMTFTWQTPADLQNNTGATQEISVATAGTYTVKVQGSLAGGCSATLSRDLVVNPTPVLAINRTDAAAGWEGCAGTTLELKAAVTASAKPYTYVWTGATKVAGGKDSLATLTLAAGSNTVTVTVTDNNSCSVSKQQSLTGNTIDVKLTGTPAGQIIAGQSVKLKATVSLGTADTYIYTEVGKTGVLGTKDTLTVKPAASTAYQVVVLSDKGCKDTASYNVNVGSTTPTLTITGEAICKGTDEMELTATATGGKANYKYEWSSLVPGITFTPSVVTGQEGASTVKLTGLAALAANPQITVKLTDSDNKIISENYTITINPRPAVKINGKQDSDTTFCVGATGARLMASGATNYTWLTPAGVAGNHDATLAVATASAMNVTEYQVVGKSVAGCVDTATIRVTVQALPEVTITGDKKVCAGTETTLTANVTGTGNYTYSWDGPTATADATYTVKPVKGDNQITLTVKDAKGCWANATHGINGMGMTIELIANPLKQNYDKDEQIQLQALIQDGGKATNYRFVNTSVDPMTEIYSGTQDTVSVRPDGIYIYRVYVTSEDHSCIDSASIRINVKDMPLSIKSEGQAVCQATPNGNLVKFTAEASGGMGDYDYTWEVDPTESADVRSKLKLGPSTLTPNKTSEVYVTSIGDLTAGKYKIKVTVQDTNILGVTIKKDTFTYLTINPLPDVKIKVGDKLLGTDTLFCLNTPNVKLTASDSATTTKKWAWTVAGVIASTTTDQVVTTTTVTTAPVKYKVEITNKFGCVDTAKVNVTIAPLPTVTIEGPAVACVGTNIALKAIAKNGKLPYDYEWEGMLNGGQTSIIGDSIVDIGDDGYFTEVYVRVTDENKCESALRTHNLEWTTGPDLEKKLIVTDSCSQATLVLRGKNLTGAGYTWTLTPSTAQGNPGGNDSTYIVTTAPDGYTVEVVAESANKVCTDTARISGNIMDVQLAAQFKSERDTCGALKMPLTLTKAGTTTVQDVQVKYSYQAFGQTDRVERDTVFNTTALATAAIATPDPGIYRLISVTDTTHGCSTPASGSVRVGFQPKAVITPQNNMGFYNVDSKDVDYVLHVKNPDNTKATYAWTSDPAGKMTTYSGTTDSIHYNLAAAGVDTVKYFLTATAKGDVVCISRDTVSVQVGVLDLPAPVIAIDTNTNRLDIKIHWEPVAGATGYKVYSRKWDPYGLVTADNGGNYTAQTVTGTEFTRSAADVATDTLAFYYVTAVNAGGTESVPSDTVGFVYHKIESTDADMYLYLYAFPYIFDMSKYGCNELTKLADYIAEGKLLAVGPWNTPTQGWNYLNYVNIPGMGWMNETSPLNLGDCYIVQIGPNDLVEFVLMGNLNDCLNKSFTMTKIPGETTLNTFYLPFKLIDKNTPLLMTDKVIRDINAIGYWNFNLESIELNNKLPFDPPMFEYDTPRKAGYDVLFFDVENGFVWP